MKKAIKILLIFLCLFSILLGVGCGRKASNNSFDAEPSYQEETVYSKNSDGVTTVTTKMVIYNYQYAISGRNLKEIIENFINIVVTYGGYTENNNVSYYQDTSEVNYANYTFRVPSSALEDFSKEIDGKFKITYKRLDSVDITEKYTSNEARIEVLNASRAAYVKILEQEDLSYSDIIQINDKISNIDTELLNLQLIQERYENQVDYSTIRVNFNNNREIRSNFFSEYVDYLEDFFVGLFKFVMYSIPVVVVLGGVACAIVLPIVHKNKKKNLNK